MGRLRAKGVRLLAVQTLRRRTKMVDGEEVVVEHFGYADGDAQPEVEWLPKTAERDHVPLGELLLGHRNSADDEPVTAQSRRWRNSSFLVLRKYRQFVGRLQSAVDDAARRIPVHAANAAQAQELVYAKLMGRGRDGSVLADPLAKKENNFDYQEDVQGKQCPLHAHIRRVNPRPAAGGGLRFPRLMRRSMAYGPAAPDTPTTAADQEDRGLVFMAYNASLGEQFEVLQRWLAGGNSTGASSQQSCPILGVPENGLPRRYRFEHDERIFHVDLDAPTPLLEEPLGPTRLEWGLYLIAPSLSALAFLRQQSDAAANAGRAPVPWQIAKGRALLAHLQATEAAGERAAALEAWKAAIEDPDSIDRLDAAALWAAIRADHGGLLRTSYGVLVAERALVADVYRDVNGCYSVSGQFDRMRRSFGEIALGLDDGPAYRQQSEAINGAIGKLDADEVQRMAHDAATHAIDALIAHSRKQAVDGEQPRFELVFEAREVLDEVLATLSEAWFGLEGSRHFRRGGQDWAWQDGEPPLYPGHFTALSRYMFQAHPGDVPVELGQRYGRALRDAMLGFVRDQRALPAGQQLPQFRGGDAPLAKVLFEHPQLGQDDGFVSRAMVGVLMGFNPTIIGAVINVLTEWRRAGTFSALRATVRRATPADGTTHVEQTMLQAARMRPMPQTGWRTVRKPHRIGPAGAGGIDLQTGERVVMSMVSGMQQSLEDGRDDERLMFGGKREVQPSPTHACPGYAAGIAAMRGTLLALLSRSEPLREGPSPATFVIEGDSGYRRPAEPERAAQTTPARVRPPLLAELDRRWKAAAAASTGGRILAWGDSWVDYRLATRWGTTLADFIDLRDALGELKYRFVADDEFALFDRWGTVRGMAADAQHLFRRRLKKELDGTRPPKAVLLSGGGNDTTRGVLQALGAATPGALDPHKVDAHVKSLVDAYRVVLTDLRDNAIDKSAAPPPLVLIHGYDNPIPAGHSKSIPASYVRQWLFDPFIAMGFVDPADPKQIDLGSATQAMQGLIDKLNAGLAAFHRSTEFSWVRYVNLRGTVSIYHPASPLDGWDNDLHVNADMFRAMALTLHEALVQP